MSGGAAHTPTPELVVKDKHREVWALVLRAQAGDMEAFGCIYNTYVSLIFQFAYSRTGNRHTAEDIASETFVRAQARIGSVVYKGRDLGAWLVTIARNLIADEYKSSHHRRVCLIGEHEFMLDHATTDPALQPDVAVIMAIRDKALREAILKLVPEQQQCIAYRFIMEIPLKDVADLMDKNVGAVKALQYRAINSLRRHLKTGTITW